MAMAGILKGIWRIAFKGYTVKSLIWMKVNSDK
jgi:hypothetical protein